MKKFGTKRLALGVGVLLAAASYAVMPGFASASPVDNPNDKAYVVRTAVPDNAKAKAEGPTAAQLKAYVPQSVRLVDSQATPETVALYDYLAALPKTGHYLYGHQNDAHHKMFRIKPGDGTNSDTKDVTGSLAGVIGVDALSLTGAELTLTPEEKEAGVTYTQKLLDISEKANAEGAILTLSMHMPNFDAVAKKGKVDGHYDFGGYSPNNLSGNVAHRILPGGDLHEVYTAYLDMVADYALALQKKHIPVIFRPFHEHNGSWFWWGKGSTSEADFLKLWQTTVQYMRDEKGVHNFLYAYSPNGPCTDSGTYLDRYPGNSYVDILGLDFYCDNNNANWYDDLRDSLDVMRDLAKASHKITALTEAGIRNGGSLAIKGNDKKWFHNTGEIVRKSGASYFLTWANFEKLEHNFFEPYMVSPTRGHEMVNDFVNFYNEPATIFADGVKDYTELAK